MLFIARRPLLEFYGLLLLQSIVISIFSSSIIVTAHERCGTEHPNDDHLEQMEHAERSLFGKTVNEMERSDFSEIFHSMRNRRNLLFFHGIPTSYQLINVPIVYHVLSKQDGGSKFSPSLTKLQADFATNITNEMYNIYDKKIKESVQFIQFITNETIIHDDFIKKGSCNRLSKTDYRTIVTKSNDWEYKMHAIICGMNGSAGLAGSPITFAPTHPRHNAAILDFRAMSCYDNDNNFICDLTNGTQISNRKWKVSQSKVMAHEFGHIFGLLHTQDFGCLFNGDGVSDTPAERSVGNDDCPGLLPYDKDRDLFDKSLRLTLNTFTDPDECSYHGKDPVVCGTTCGACCDTLGNKRLCPLYKEGGIEVLPEDEMNIVCCEKDKPSDTCILRHGIDPKNNVMSYAPDYCIYELTPGQMARMMAQIRKYKDYIYCNYVNFKDTEKCANIPCSSIATSPNCIP